MASRMLPAECCFALAGCATAYGSAVALRAMFLMAGFPADYAGSPLRFEKPRAAKARLEPIRKLRRARHRWCTE